MGPGQDASLVTIAILAVALVPLMIGIAVELLGLRSSPTIVQPGDERPERAARPAAMTGGEGLTSEPASSPHPRPPQSQTFLSENSRSAR